ncbi:aminoglycoside phosphotransferase family protein [Pseudonocardia kunmingensis]|uniref:Streptomycin 6-kinase n=1 Tax=Pseudonocardia kunmingensis TaxID=630975 RepID=A0A543E146_9PSEU|nr:aminoglycoside phosphotransferase family protein [Pseudonocardia kunmingensis]TQM15318.1 streptomycin 6-kinase [Pseudonocardia kunmingensis]
MDVPEVVRAKALQAGAGAWLAELPDLVSGLERDWGITVGRAFGDPTEAYVAEAALVDGTPVVLKLLVPRPGLAADEITVLRLADGAGCVRLLASDVERSALLLDRLGPSLYALGLPLGRRLEVMCDLAVRLWRPAPDADLRTGAEKGRWLAEHIEAMWAQLDAPCSRAAVDHALACADRRVAAHVPERAVLVHGDVHQWNTLQTRDGGFALVDPDGLLAEPEYDLGILMREDPVELMAGDPRERARWLATRTGCDPVAVWEWGVIERVSTGLLATAIGLQPVGGQMLAASDAIAHSLP